MDWLTPLAGIEPLPTTFRQVSGKKRVKTTKRKPEKITRNQKVQRQPRY